MSHEHRSFLHRHLILILAVALVTVIAVALFSRPSGRPLVRPQVEALALTSSGDAREVALSPDGSRIAYLVDGGTALVVRELPEGAALDLARGAVRLGPPRWSPDGSTLLYACPLPRALCNVSTSGGGIDTIAVTTGVGVTAYGFAPDGAYVIATAVGPWIYRGSRPASLTLVGEDAVAAEGNVIDLRSVVEWVVGVDYWQAPTCATCHMSATRTQEVTHDIAEIRGIVARSAKDGYLTVPEGPGLGITLSESGLKKWPFEDKDIEAATPIKTDGSVGDRYIHSQPPDSRTLYARSGFGCQGSPGNE